MKNFITSIINLFAPPICEACGEPLPDGIDFLCPRCRWELPLTEFWLEKDNPVAEKFWGLIPFNTACSLFYFRQGSNFRKTIHDFKYRGHWKISYEYGRILGQKLTQSPLYDNVDIIVPIPLHSRKFLKRGYNQSQYIAQGIANTFNRPVSLKNVIRKVNNKPQIKSETKYKRWDNVKDIFEIKNPEKLEGKHILLVDDVLTTGATINSCAQSIINSVKNCKISIATVSVSEYEIKKRRNY